MTGTIQDKTAQCIKNLKTVLEEAGSGIEKVVKVNVFITDMANFAVSPPCPSCLRCNLPADKT